MIDLPRMAALVAVLGTAVVFGTDVFCAIVQRPALAAVDDRTLVAVMGNVHRYGDRRMPIPGVVGLVATTTSAALAAFAGRWAEAVSAAVALCLLLAWLVLYLRISAPINRQLVTAAGGRDVPSNVRALQDDWDQVINARAIILGLAVAALCLSLTL